MDDEEEEMARLRKSKRYQAFERKFDRNGARITQNDSQKTMQQQITSNTNNSKKRSRVQLNDKEETIVTNENQTETNNDNNNNNNNTNDPIMAISAEELNNLPTSFGKRKSSPNHKHNHNDKNKIDFSEEFKSDDEAEDEEDDDVTSDNKKNENKKLEKRTKKYLKYVSSEYGIPLKYCAKLKGHNKLISTMDLDRSGTRLISGSYDNTVKFWDFGGMNESLESFRSITPHDGYPIISLKYNHSGSMFLCCTGSHKPLIYTRDGKQICEFKQGDMYIRDMNHTFGHTMPLMGGKWFGYNYLHENMDEICTWSQDSTFRIWDIHQTDGKCKQIIKGRNKTGKRVSITSADINNGIHNSLLIVLGCNDGSIQLFDHKSHCKRPKKTITDAHVSGTDISCIKFDEYNSNVFLSRGGKDDNTLKVWDIRKLSEINGPIKVFDKMWNITSLSNIIQSPAINNKNQNKNLYITQCSNNNDEKIGKSCLCFIDSKNLIEMIRIPISDRSINCALWHKKINQLFVGGNDSQLRVYYEDKPISKNGILLCAKRKMKKKHIDEQMTYFKIINPNALRVYKRQTDIIKDKMKKDLRLHKPEYPHYGIGVAGRINTESFSHHVYKSAEKNIMSQVDPRDRLLLFDEKAKTNQQFTAIYNINQPKPVFKEPDENEENITETVYKAMPDKREYNPLDPPPSKKQKTS